MLRPSLLHVINATGVILHTNLGRAPLSSAPAADTYSNLEYDLTPAGAASATPTPPPLLKRLSPTPRHRRQQQRRRRLSGPDELAAGGEVVISRGEFIEIGDGFRIPDIMARSGAALREVGTTNRTRIDDYREAITPARGC